MCSSDLTKIVSKVAAKAGKEGLERAGIKIGGKAAAKAGAKLGVSAAAKTATLGPVGIALIAFDVVSIGLDITDAGGYMKMGTKKVYKNVKDEISFQFKDILAKEGLTHPLIAGPMDKLSEEQITDLSERKVKAILDDPNNPMMKKLTDAVVQQTDLDTEEKVSAWIEENITKFIDFDKLMEQAFNSICVDNGGKMYADGSCG